MYGILVAVHVTSAALVVGSLFLQSLIVVMALRLPDAAHREGVRVMQQRVHLFIYYPILAVTLITGLWQAWLTGAFGAGLWLHWKLLLVVLLIGLGLLTGRELRAERIVKPMAMLVHIGIFLLSILIIYLASVKPF